MQMAIKILSNPKKMKFVQSTKSRLVDNKEEGQKFKVWSPSLDSPAYFSTEKNLLWMADMFK